MNGWSLVPLFKGSESLQSPVISAIASRGFSNLIQTTLPSLLRFPSRFSAFLKRGEFRMSARMLALHF